MKSRRVIRFVLASFAVVAVLTVGASRANSAAVDLHMGEQDMGTASKAWAGTSTKLEFHGERDVTGRSEPTDRSTGEKLEEIVVTPTLSPVDEMGGASALYGSGGVGGTFAGDLDVMGFVLPGAVTWEMEAELLGDAFAGHVDFVQDFAGVEGLVALHSCALVIDLADEGYHETRPHGLQAAANTAWCPP